MRSFLPTKWRENGTIYKEQKALKKEGVFYSLGMEIQGYTQTMQLIQCPNVQ